MFKPGKEELKLHNEKQKKCFLSKYSIMIF